MPQCWPSKALHRPPPDGRSDTHVSSQEPARSIEVVARSMRINRRTIYGWLAQYRRGGWGALKAKPLFGRPP
ncbi:MAG: helix-turn-helix domain-containing protein, partial [Rhodoplanes sp.]